MTIDWFALGLVSVVSVVASVAFVTLLSLGVRYVSLARVRANSGGSVALPQAFGYGFLGLAALLVLFCLYLIVPQLH